MVLALIVAKFALLREFYIAKSSSIWMLIKNIYTSACYMHLHKVRYTFFF